MQRHCPPPAALASGCPPQRSACPVLLQTLAGRHVTSSMLMPSMRRMPRGRKATGSCFLATRSPRRGPAPTSAAPARAARVSAAASSARHAEGSESSQKPGQLPRWVAPQAGGGHALQRPRRVLPCFRVRPPVAPRRRARRLCQALRQVQRWRDGGGGRPDGAPDVAADERGAAQEAQGALVLPCWWRRQGLWPAVAFIHAAPCPLTRSFLRLRSWLRSWLRSLVWQC